MDVWQADGCVHTLSESRVAKKRRVHAKNGRFYFWTWWDFLRFAGGGNVPWKPALAMNATRAMQTQQEEAVKRAQQVSTNLQRETVTARPVARASTGCYRTNR